RRPTACLRWCRWPCRGWCPPRPRSDPAWCPCACPGRRHHPKSRGPPAATGRAKAEQRSSRASKPPHEQHSSECQLHRQISVSSPAATRLTPSLPHSVSSSPAANPSVLNTLETWRLLALSWLG